MWTDARSGDTEVLSHESRGLPVKSINHSVNALGRITLDGEGGANPPPLRQSLRETVEWAESRRPTGQDLVRYITQVGEMASAHVPPLTANLRRSHSTHSHLPTLPSLSLSSRSLSPMGLDANFPCPLPARTIRTTRNSSWPALSLPRACPNHHLPRLDQQNPTTTAPPRKKQNHFLDHKSCLSPARLPTANSAIPPQRSPGMDSPSLAGRSKMHLGWISTSLVATRSEVTGIIGRKTRSVHSMTMGWARRETSRIDRMSGGRERSGGREASMN